MPTPQPSKQPIQSLRQRVLHALSHSLQMRLIGLFVLMALALGAIFLFGMQTALSLGWRDAARPLVTDYIDRLATEIGSPPDIARAQAIAQRLPVSVRISGPQVNWHSDTHEPAYPDAPRVFARTTLDGHRIQFGINGQAWHKRPRYVGWATLAVLLLLTAFAYARVRRMLRPLDTIRAGAQRFGAGNFAQPIPLRAGQRPDQLDELARTINTMGRDIHHMLEAKRALLLAISHELRSPLTRARLNTELLPETPAVQPSRDALLRDLALMRDLITDLLESERLAAPHAALHCEPVNLIAMVQEVVKELANAKDRALGVLRGDGAKGVPDAQVITTEFSHEPASGAMPHTPADTLAQLDPSRVRLLLRNLLDNALRYSAQAARPPVIRVHTMAHGAYQISVRDFGPGVAPDQLAHLGQAFYRTDAARTREGGGVGLGLYLCRLVAQAHGGTFVVRNALPGLEVTVVLPNVHT